MISSTTSSDHAARLDALATASQATVRTPTAKPDRISTSSAAFLQSALVAQPEIRPEVVERARALAADPNYPSPEIMRGIAQQILAAPDLSERRAGRHTNLCK